jgi:MFS transporter, DHA2 family, multidrug resistance protein
MLVPAGVLAFLGLLPILTDRGRQVGVRLDWIGFLALMVAVVGFQLMLDRGQREDWFDSAEIVIEAAVAALGFYVFLVHSLTADRPFLNPRLLLDRNYALGLLLVGVYGMLNFTPMVLMPPMLKGLMGYPDSIIGELLSWRGAGALIGFFLAIYVGKLDPRIGMAVGFAIQAWSGWLMMGFDVNVTVVDVALCSTLQGVAIGLIWVPLIVASFSTLDSRYLAESSAIFHLTRNIGSSVFISLSVTALTRSGAATYEQMTAFSSPFHEPLVRGDRILTDQWSLDSTAGLARLAREIARQASMIGYLDAFGLYTLASLAALPLVLLVRVRKPE